LKGDNGLKWTQWRIRNGKNLNGGILIVFLKGFGPPNENGKPSRGDSNISSPEMPKRIKAIARWGRYI
jgi:hypothetical protein